MKNKVLDNHAISKGFKSFIEMVNTITPEELQDEMMELFNIQRSIYLNAYEPWSTIDIMENLIDSAEILLNRLDYDVIGWEDRSGCIKRGRELIKKIIENEKNNFKSGK